MVDLRNPILPLDTRDSGSSSGDFKHGNGANRVEGDINAKIDATFESGDQAELNSLESGLRIPDNTQNLDPVVNIKAEIAKPAAGNSFGISHDATPQKNLEDLISIRMSNQGEVLKSNGTIGDDFLKDTERLVGQ